MRAELLQKYDRRVPRYTSYPTAPHFHSGIDGTDYGRWLSELVPHSPVSLYLHVPFCHSLCWFCGCHTRVVNRYQPVAEYLALLEREIDLVSAYLPGRLAVSHIHFGGGTPTILTSEDLSRLVTRLAQRFEIGAEAEIAIEVDPRSLTREMAQTLGRLGVRRVSLGVQDVNFEVQKAINRLQPFAVTRRAVDMLREAGVQAFNVDLMYGLPHQTVDRLIETVERVLELDPQRIALFGYAHVPWMKRHQRLVDEAALPDAPARLAAYEAAAARLCERGYEPVGLDHFAKPGDPLAAALREGRLHRNFQGYTTDTAPVLIGFGASAIGALPQGYVQNKAAIRAYRETLVIDRLATERGVALDRGDRLRRAVIERLMCELEADLAEICARFDEPVETLASSVARLAEFAADGLVEIEGRWKVRVVEEARPFVRVVCTAFDAYLESGKGRHAASV